LSKIKRRTFAAVGSGWLMAIAGQQHVISSVISQAHPEKLFPD